MHMQYKSFRWIPMIIEYIITKWQMSYSKGEEFLKLSKDKIILLWLSNNRQLSSIQAF